MAIYSFVLDLDNVFEDLVFGVIQCFCLMNHFPCSVTCVCLSICTKIIASVRSHCCVKSVLPLLLFGILVTTCGANEEISWFFFGGY